MSGLVLGWVVVGAPPAQAATITVTSPADAGPGTLRQAVIDAAPGDTITFSSPLNGVPIQVTSAPIQIAKNLTIRGNGAAFTLVHGNVAIGPRIFSITAGNVTIDAVTIGTVRTLAAGAAIDVTAGGTLTLTRSQLSNTESASNGGALRNGGTTTITNSVIANNRANNCAGALTAGTMTLVDTLVEGNVAVTSGDALGGGSCNEGTLTLTNTDVISNHAETNPASSAAGGGIVSSAAA